MAISMLSFGLLRNVASKNSFEAQTKKYIATLKKALPKIKMGNTVIDEIFLYGLDKQSEIIEELAKNGMAVYRTSRLVNGSREKREEIMRMEREGLGALVSFWEVLGFRFNIGETKNIKLPENDFYEIFETKITIVP